MCAMFGWFSAASAFASRSKRGESVGILRERRGEDFDGYVAIEARIYSAIHFAHSAGSELVDELEQTETLAGRERHNCWHYVRKTTGRGPALRDAFGLLTPCGRKRWRSGRLVSGIRIHAF